MSDNRRSLTFYHVNTYGIDPEDNEALFHLRLTLSSGLLPSPEKALSEIEQQLSAIETDENRLMVPVLKVDCPADKSPSDYLEHLFALTQHVEANWVDVVAGKDQSYHASPKAELDYHILRQQSRSTSVGDMAVDDQGAVHMVDSIGFRQMDIKPELARKMGLEGVAARSASRHLRGDELTP